MTLLRVARFLSGYGVLERMHSRHNGTIEVIRQFGETRVVIDNLTQSGEPIKLVWGKTVARISHPSPVVLILGLGSGTLAHLLASRFHQISLTGVELDPVMVDIGKRYFRLDSLTSLHVTIADALAYTRTEVQKKSRFTHIFVDLYRGSLMPKKFTSSTFFTLLSRLAPAGEIYINRLFYDDPTRSSAQKFVASLTSHFGDSRLSLSRVFTNLIITILPPPPRGSSRSLEAV